MTTSRMNLFWLIVFAATMPVAVIVSTQLARRSFEKVRIREQTITVKGYAEQPITSDRAIWRATIVERNPDRTAAYASLEEGRRKLLAYLDRYGISETEVEFGPVTITAEHRRNEDGYTTNEIELYRLGQRFQIEGDDVQRIATIAREAGSLIGEGVELQAESPSYLYTKLESMKLEMLSQATANARERAERLVDGSGNGIGDLRSANQGVFQITPAYSTEVSGSGYNDTSSIAKSIKAVVTVEYAVE